jgi:hypothetical protein
METDHDVPDVLKEAGVPLQGAWTILYTREITLTEWLDSIHHVSINDRLDIKTFIFSCTFDTIKPLRFNI